MSKHKTLKFVKIRCRTCGHLNLIPVIRRFRLHETLRCEKCSSTIAKPE